MFLIMFFMKENQPFVMADKHFMYIDEKGTKDICVS